jgi:hypothetical protein
LRLRLDLLALLTRVREQNLQTQSLLERMLATREELPQALDFSEAPLCCILLAAE